jgi:hypothetical protein
MLFDRSFAEEVTDDPVRLLREFQIPIPLLHQLKHLDVRLWYADRLRPLRAMKVLVSEYRVTTTLYLDATRRFQDLMNFFQSESFHRTVMNRGYMSLAFGDYLRSLLAAATKHTQALPEVLQLEQRMAFARRERREWNRRPTAFHPEPHSSFLRLRPGTVVVSLRRGTLAAVQEIERFLFEAAEIPALSLCSDSPRPPDTDALLCLDREAFLLESADTGSVSTSELSEDYLLVCESLSAPKIDGISERSNSVQADRERELLEALLEAGVVVRMDATVKHNKE